MSDSVSINNGVAVGNGARPIESGLPSWRRWWALDRKAHDGIAVANAIESTVKQMKLNQGARMDQATLAARLYGNAPISMLMGGATRGGAGPFLPASGAANVTKQNVIQSIVDTSTATIGENKPRPYFLTDGGDYKLQRQAKKLNQFSDGMFYELHAYDVGSEAQRDCEIFGDGWLHVGIEFGRLKYTRVLSVELWCDELEAAMSLPPQLHWERPVDRERVLALYPKKKELITRASRVMPREYGAANQSTSDMILVRHSWHLRSGAESTDGVCVVSVEHGLLSECEWKQDWYPFAQWKWTPRPAGFWSQGLAEQLQSQQIEYNKLNWSIQQAMHRAGTYKVLLEMGSKVVDEHLSNEVGAIIKYRGTKPEYVVPPAVHPDWFARKDQLKNEMYELAGLSRLTATGEKPAGLNSGEAQRVYRDSVAQRMKTQERLNEQGYLQLALIGIAVAREEVLRTGKPYEVRSSNQRNLRRISMTAEELNPKDWRTQCFPTSSLPKDPAGRYATIQEWIQAGFLSMRQGKKLMDFPDLQAHEALDTAEEDLLQKTLDDIVDEGVYAPPEPTDNLELAKELVLEYINFGRLHGLEPERLALLHDWNAQVDALMMAAMPPPTVGAPGPGASMGGGPPSVPQGLPAAPPQSNLLPFAA